MLITFGQVLDIGIKRLEQAGTDGAERDANLLLQYFMNEDRNFIFLHRNDGTDEDHAEAYFELIDRRAEGEPLQYIVGTQEFMGHEFKVDPSVLIPRPDTETVVEFALSRIGEMKKCRSLLDMCCGSGAIAVSVAKAVPGVEIMACDCSQEALDTAAQNIALNGVDHRVNLKQTDMFQVQKKKKNVPLKEKFDMIICNPPYIPSGVIPTLQKEVREHEPLMALDGGADGLDFYRIIAAEAADHMKKKGCMVLEIGHDQGAAVMGLLEETGRYQDISVHKDLAGHDRIVYCSLAGGK